MSNPLYELYRKQQYQDLTKDFIQDAFSIMMQKEKDLLPYITDFKVQEREDNLLGSYSNYEKQIIIYQETINTLKTPMNSNLMAIEVIRHEMEHARNLKTLEEGRKDIESLVVSYSLKDYAIEQELDYSTFSSPLDLWMLTLKIKENYETNPGERLVEIKAAKYLVNLLKNQRISDDLLQARRLLYYSYIRGYKNNRYYLDAPTYQFLFETNMLQELKRLRKRVESKNYTLEKRLTYGLPLTYKEYDEKVLQKVKLQRRIERTGEK